MTREEWNKAFAAQITKRAGWEEEDAIGLAHDSGDIWFDEGDDPTEAADEEMSYWD